MEGQLFNSNVIIAIISVVGGIVTTILTLKYKDRVMKKAGLAPAKDRMETIFDGYEKLIVQQQEEISRKASVIQSLENVVDRLDEELARTRQLLNEAREDLSATRQQNEELKDQLSRMKREYGTKK